MDDQTRSPGTGSGPVSERIQALLSRAAEDQIVEQRAVSTSLTDLRDQVAAVAETVRGGASATTVEQLRGELAGNASEVRRTYAQLSERLDALTERVDEVGTSTAQGGPGSERLAVRLTAIGSDLTSLSGSVDEVASAVASFPDALASLQRDLAGLVADRLVDRLAPSVTEQVLAGLSPALVEQVASAAAAQVLSGVASLVHESELASERRILAHVDEAVLALAGALLRRRRTLRPDALPTNDPARQASAPAQGGPEGPPLDVQESALDTGVLDIDELRRAIAATEAEQRTGGTEQVVFDNDADAEVSVDDPAGGQDRPTADPYAEAGPVPGEPVDEQGSGDGPAGQDLEDVADGSDPKDVEVQEGDRADAEADAQAATSHDPGGAAPTRTAGSLEQADPPAAENDPGRTAAGGRAGVSGGSAPRRARSTMPPLPPVMPAAEPHADDHDEDDSRRRPWWRPGG